MINNYQNPPITLEPITSEVFDKYAQPTNCIVEMKKIIKEEREKTTLDPTTSRILKDQSTLLSKVVGHEE